MLFCRGLCSSIWGLDSLKCTAHAPKPAVGGYIIMYLHPSPFVSRNHSIFFKHALHTSRGQLSACASCLQKDILDHDSTSDSRFDDKIAEFTMALRKALAKLLQQAFLLCFVKSLPILHGPLWQPLCHTVHGSCTHHTALWSQGLLCVAPECVI